MAKRDPANDGITDAMVQEAKVNGEYAWHAGKCLDDNPYPYGSKQWNAWRKGMMRAANQENA